MIYTEHDSLTVRNLKLLEVKKKLQMDGQMMAFDLRANNVSSITTGT
jgi:hypothetical protein